MKLNSSSSQPLYVQLKDIIKSDIHSGIYKEQEKIPTETDFCKSYSVSRITTRKALTALVEEGILERRQGKGTFIKRQALKRELISVNGFSEHMHLSGRTPHSQILSCEVVEADLETATQLHSMEGEKVIQLKRINFIDSDPFVLETSCYLLTRFPNLEKYITQTQSTYQTLLENYNVEVAHNSRIISVVLATKEQADYLQCYYGTPLFFTKKVAYDQDTMPIHTSSLYIQANKTTFTLTTNVTTVESS